jgi:dihydroorotase
VNAEIFDTVIRGATVVSATGRIEADIGIRDGRIAALHERDFANPLRATTVIEAEGLHVLPGVIDVHSHHREPGFTHKEDIITATRACAAGGVTTTFAMPNVAPPPNTAERLETMMQLYASRSIVDWNINAAATIPSALKDMASLGIAAFKIFMVEDTARSYPHMPGTGVHDHGKLLEIFEAVHATELPLMVHPHDQQLMSQIERGFWDRGERDFRAYARAYASYDGLIWDTAAALLIRLQLATGTRLHLLHTQTRGVVDQLREAKHRGQAVTAEVNPWAVFLGNDWATIERLGSYALSYWVPKENTPALWEALRDGTIDIISTDHAPHTREEKELGRVDGWKAHTGTPSAQFYLSLFLNASAGGDISLERVVDLTSTRPASVFGLANKGRVETGSDADLVVVDLSKEFEISDEIVESKIGWTPYAGRRLRGAVISTFVRGRVVYQDGRVIGPPGWGQQAVPARPTRRDVEAE